MSLGKTDTHGCCSKCEQNKERMMHAGCSVKRSNVNQCLACAEVDTDFTNLFIYAATQGQDARIAVTLLSIFSVVEHDIPYSVELFGKLLQITTSSFQR